MHLRLTTKHEKQKQEEQTHLRNDTERERERERERETETPTTTTILKKQTLKKNCLQQDVGHHWATLLWTSNPINPI
jgi:hypothetical protein